MDRLRPVFKGFGMPADVAKDQFAVIRIEGMHCHKCEQSIQKALSSEMGVHEVEVDFNSGQVSVLFDRSVTTVGKLMDVINQKGYRASGFTMGDADARA